VKIATFAKPQNVIGNLGKTVVYNRFLTKNEQTMKHIIVYLTIITLIIGCQRKNLDLVGEYKIYKPSYTDKIFRYFKYNGWTVGTELKLKKDSTFEMTNCSMFIKGKWTNNSDSLFLKIESKKFRIDSLNNSPKWKNWLEIGKGLYPYKIDGKFLECEKKDSTGNLSLEKLEKIVHN
jgi:hypothetical protein